MGQLKRLADIIQWQFHLLQGNPLPPVSELIDKSIGLSATPQPYVNFRLYYAYGRSMATILANEGEGSSRFKTNLDGYKFPKIPIDQVYKKRIFRIFPSYAVTDYEETITLKATNQDVSINLFTSDFFKGFFKKKQRFLHLGLVQIAIKPLLRDGIGAPVVVCVRDARHLNWENSLLALVESNLSQGPFYFNCFPSFSVNLADSSSLKSLTSYLMTSGIPLAVTYRLVCKAMVDLSSEALQEPVLGETTFIHPTTGTRSSTKWNELRVPESWMHKEEPKEGGNFLERLPDGRHILRFPSARGADDEHDDEYDNE